MKKNRTNNQLNQRSALLDRTVDDIHASVSKINSSIERL